MRVPLLPRCSPARLVSLVRAMASPFVGDWDKIPRIPWRSWSNSRCLATPRPYRGANVSKSRRSSSLTGGGMAMSEQHVSHRASHSQRFLSSTLSPQLSSSFNDKEYSAVHAYLSVAAHWLSAPSRPRLRVAPRGPLCRGTGHKDASRTWSFARQSDHGEVWSSSSVDGVFIRARPADGNRVAVVQERKYGAKATRHKNQPWLVQSARQEGVYWWAPKRLCGTISLRISAKGISRPTSWGRGANFIVYFSPTNSSMRMKKQYEPQTPKRYQRNFEENLQFVVSYVVAADKGVAAVHAQHC